jgi:hypothetical protein
MTLLHNEELNRREGKEILVQSPTRLRTSEAAIGQFMMQELSSKVPSNHLCYIWILWFLSAVLRTLLLKVTTVAVPVPVAARSTAANLLPSWVRIPMGAWMFVCCVLSGRGLCDELNTRPGESYRLWRVVVYYHETSWYEEAIARAGLQSQRNKQQTTVSVVL